MKLNFCFIYMCQYFVCRKAFNSIMIGVWNFFLKRMSYHKHRQIYFHVCMKFTNLIYQHIQYNFFVFFAICFMFILNNWSISMHLFHLLFSLIRINLFPSLNWKNWSCMCSKFSSWMTLFTHSIFGYFFASWFIRKFTLIIYALVHFPQIAYKIFMVNTINICPNVLKTLLAIDFCSFFLFCSFG